MRISFKGYTNFMSVYVNIARFRLADGSEIVVDRDDTSWHVAENGDITMEWDKCYEWNGEEPKYYTYGDKEIFKGAVCTDFEIEDDAPKGYTFGLKKVFVEDIIVPVAA